MFNWRHVQCPLRKHVQCPLRKYVQCASQRAPTRLWSLLTFAVEHWVFTLTRINVRRIWWRTGVSVRLKLICTALRNISAPAASLSLLNDRNWLPADFVYNLSRKSPIGESLRLLSTNPLNSSNRRLQIRTTDAQLAPCYCVITCW